MMKREGIIITIATRGITVIPAPRVIAGHLVARALAGVVGGKRESRRLES